MLNRERDVSALDLDPSGNTVFNLNQPETTFPIVNARDKQPTNDGDASDTVNEQPILNEQPVICLKFLLVSRGKICS